jgi:hypothetical protein
LFINDKARLHVDDELDSSGLGQADLLDFLSDGPIRQFLCLAMTFSFQVWLQFALAEFCK